MSSRAKRGDPVTLGIASLIVFARNDENCYDNNEIGLMSIL